MKPFKIFTSILFVLATALLVATVFEFNPLATTTALVGASVFIKMPQGVSLMALQKEIWQSDIIENLYKDNAFATKAFNGDQYVLAGKVVHIPVSGTAAVIKKNLTSFPQTAVNRTDSEITYSLDNYYALPRQIQKLEQ